jgi:transposase
MYAGIDTHKDTLAVAVIDDAGRQVAGAQLPNTQPGFVRLVELLECWPVRRVGIEGSGGFGRAIAVHLVVGWAPASTPASASGWRWLRCRR